MKSSANRKKKDELGALDQSRWDFIEQDDFSSSGSSIPDNLNLIDGEIEIIQSNKSLTEDDKISPVTALHKIKVKSDQERSLLSKCSSISTDWAIELESSFFKGGQLLVRKISPGSTFSHCYDNQRTFDVVVIRAHLTAKSGNDTVFEGYFCRRQKLSNPLERSLAKKFVAISRKNPSYFRNLSDTREQSLSETEQLRANGDFRENEIFPSHSPSFSISGNDTTGPRGNTNLPSEAIPGLLLASGDNEPIQMAKGLKKFNEGSKIKKPIVGDSSTETSSKTTVEQVAHRDAHEQTPKVDLPDPKRVPKAVLDVCDFDNFIANKKVIDYLNHLEEGAALINNHLENEKEVNEEDISSLRSASSAILREYGYDFPETTRTKKQYRRYTRKISSPRDESDTTSESDVSDSELKSEVVKRAIEGKDFSELLDLLKNSKEWIESVKDDWASGSASTGKIEHKIHQHYP